MDVIVTAKCEVPARVRQDAIERVQHAARFADPLLTVDLVFGIELNPRIAEPACVELTGRTKGHHIRAEGRGADHRAAVDVAITRFERQLARYKARTRDRERRRTSRAPVGVGVAPRSNGAGPVLSAEVDPRPSIVRRKRFVLTPMLPEEAAVQLELLGHEFFLFANDATGRCNVVYRRRDGELGLIEPADADV